MAIYPQQKVGLIDVNLKSELTSLSSIVIKNNYLSSITIPTLPSLIEIDLSNNQFNETGITFDYNSTITGITISGGGLNFNTDFLVNVPNLKYLNFSDNTLTSINLNHLDSIEYIDLSINQLTEFVLQNKEYVSELKLNNNVLTSVTLSGLTGYFLLTGQQIYLNNNQLTSINLSDLNYVEYLNIGNNLLQSASFQNLNNLSYLYLNNNQLTGFTTDYPSSIINLYLNNNLITDIDLTDYVTLVELNISNNSLESFVPPSSVSIQFLNISNNPTQLNQLIDITGLTSLTELTSNYMDVTGMNMYESGVVTLYMEYCTGVTSVTFPSGILELYLSHNNLTTFNINNTSLQTIQLSYCNLTAVTFGDITSLGNIDLSHNNFATTELNQIFVDLDATTIEYGTLDVRSNPGDINFSATAFESLTITKNWNILNDGH